MADDANETLKEIGKMMGVGLEEEIEQEEQQSLEVSDDGQEEEGKQEVETSEEREGLQVEEDEDSIDARYARLLESHNQLAAQMLELQAKGFPVGSPPAPAQVETPPVREVPPPPPVPSSYVMDEALLEKALIEDDPKAMKQVITGLLQHVETLVSNTREQTREAVLRDIPYVAQSVARQQLTMMRAVEKFYTDNEDLVPYQHVIGAVANEITMKEPQLTIADALAKTEVEVRRRLGLKRAAEKLAPDRKPAMPRVSGSRKPGAPVLTGKRADIAAMMGAGS
jgi:hypothetical protein